MVDKSQFGTKTEAEMAEERKRGKERRESKSLWRRLSLELHPDQANGRSAELKKEGEALFKELADIYENRTRGVEENKILWGVLFGELEDFESSRVADYRDRVKKDAQANGSKDSKKKEKPMSHKEFIDKHPLNVHIFDKDRSSFYISGYSESTGEIEINLKLNGKEFEKKTISSVVEFEKLQKELQDGSSTLKELFESKDNDADQKEEKKEDEQDAEGREQEEFKAGEEEKEQSDKLAQLEASLEQARKGYAKTNLEVTGAYARIKRVLGEKFGKKVDDVPDVSERYRAYQERLRELRDFQLQMIKDKYANLDTLPEEEKKAKTDQLKKELGGMATYFGYDEKIKMYEARTNAGAEARKDQFGGKILEKSAEWVNYYRKWNWKTKLALSVALMAGGAVATVSGVTIAGISISALGITRRVLSGAAAGMGATVLMETLARKKEKKQAEKKKAAIFDKFDEMDKRNNSTDNKDEKANWEEKFQAFEKKLDEEINTYAESLKNERGSVNMRVLAGLFIGGVVASGYVGKFLKWGVGAAKETHIVKAAYQALGEKLGFTVSGVEVHPSGGSAPVDPNPDHSGPTNSLDEDVKPAEPLASPMNETHPTEDSTHIGAAAGDQFKHPTGVPTNSGMSNFDQVHNAEAGAVSLEHGFVSHDVEIPKGSSIEREIIKKMQELKIPKNEAGKYAHRMVLRFIEESHGQSTLEKLNLVKPGEIIKFNIDPNNLDNSNIANFRGIAVPHAGISHSGGSPINSEISQTMKDQMENEARERGFNEHIVGSEGRMAAVDAKIEAGMTQDEISRGYNSKLMGEQTLKHNSLKTDMHAQDIHDSHGAEDAVSGKAVEPSISGSTIDSGGNSESANINPEADISARVLANIDEVAEKFGGNWIDKGVISNQLSALRSLEGEKFYKMYGKIMSNIAGGIFKDHGISSLEALQHISAKEYIESGDNPKIAELIKYAKTHFKGYNFEPKNNENMASWTMRMLTKTMESCGAPRRPMLAT